MKAAEVAVPIAWPRLRQPVLLLIVCTLVVAGVLLVSPAAGFSGVLIAGIYGVSLALGTALLIAINFVAGAQWWNPVRKFTFEISSTLIVPGVVVLAAVIAGLTTLYPWANESFLAESELVAGKTAWLNAPFFILRALAVVAIWVLLTRYLAGASSPSQRVGRGAIFLLLFGVTISVAFFDWTMSLEPEWFSTMYGVYGFSGTFLGGIAAVTALVLWSGRLTGTYASEAVRHDLGRLLFAFSMFWAYIWFCQYMLIWYANLPEETGHYAVRLTGGWTMMFWLNPVINFVIPFFVLLSARAKRNPRVLLQVSFLILGGRWLDTYLMVAPSTEATLALPIVAAVATVGVLVGMVLVLKRRAAN